MQTLWVLGGVLLQHHSQAKPYFIHYMNMMFALPQHKHTIGVTECMTIMWAPHNLCDFVDGTHITIISDYHALYFVKSSHTHHHH